MTEAREGAGAGGENTPCRAGRGGGGMGWGRGSGGCLWGEWRECQRHKEQRAQPPFKVRASPALRVPTLPQDLAAWPKPS